MKEVYCKFFNTYITLYNSYTIKSIKEMKEILNNIPILRDHRSIISCLHEWRAHNLLYALGIYRNHTMHTDFNFEVKWYEKIVYFILSLLYFRW